MIVGKFKFEDGVYSGSIPSFTGSGLPVRITPSTKKGVDHDVKIGDGGIELGVAWKKTSGKGNAYLSVKLDSPFLPEPANCALLRQDDGTHALVWKRAARDEKAGQAEVTEDVAA
jgi:uncharacterized protein (DUF736 family)